MTSWEEHAAALGSRQAPREPGGRVPGEGPHPSTWPSQALLFPGSACGPSLQPAGKAYVSLSYIVILLELCSYLKSGLWNQTPSSSNLDTTTLAV